MNQLDLVRLDREIARAAREWVRWRRRLRRGEGLDEAPFALYPFISRRGYLALQELPEHDPLRSPMLRFVFRLVLDKANASLLQEAARARRGVAHPIDHPVRGSYTFAELVQRALEDAPRRRAWVVRLLDHAREVGEPVCREWERRSEIAERLAVARIDDVELPSAGIYQAAEAWLASSADAAAESRPASLEQMIETGLGLEASRGWPAKLTPTILDGWFREGRLLDSLPLDPGPLPRPIAPASALRALARLGAAFFDAAASGSLPFCIAHDPYGLARFTHGALLAGLGAWPAFLRRGLSLGGGAAREHARIMTRVLLWASRVAALRVVLRRPAMAGTVRFRDEYSEGTAAAFGFPVPASAAGCILRLSPDDPQRFAGLLLARTLHRSLVEQHDEDWYRNPRATDQLRSEAGLAPAITSTAEALSAGASLLLEEISSRL